MANIEFDITETKHAKSVTFMGKSAKAKAWMGQEYSDPLTLEIPRQEKEARDFRHSARVVYNFTLEPPA